MSKQAGWWGGTGAKLASVLVLALLASSCASWRGGKGPRVPERYAASPEAALLTNPVTRGQGYEKLFPELPKLQLTGRLVASSSWWRGKEHFDFQYFRWRPLREENPELRLRGSLIQSGPLFDVIVQHGLMTVLLHPTAEIFAGAVPDEGTAFERHFGVEPWQLSRPLIVGQELAGLTRTSDSLAAQTSATLRLRWVEYDETSGLPRSAGYGNAQSDLWTVRYGAWDYYKDEEAQGQELLLPSQVEIERHDPKIKLTLTAKSYRFANVSPAKIFVPYVDRPYHKRPLGDLDQVLDR